VDPQHALREWLGRQVGGPALKVLTRSHAFQYFVAAAPGAKELITIAKVWEIAQEGRWTRSNQTYDTVVVDAPASGHGLAMLSQWPMRNVHAIPIPNGKDKMWGKEKRLGQLRALVADIEHPSGAFRAVTIHLDAHCSRAHRALQMRIILDHLETLSDLPTLIGGDWNTTGFNSQNSRRAILGYWRRVMMGPKNVATNHFPHPDRYFESRMFTDVERRGYEYRSLNTIGVGTLHYELGDIDKNTNLRDWVPEWCFPFIFWAAGRVGGRVSARLDWFAGKGLKPVPGTRPETIAGLFDSEGKPLSDHDPITVAVRSN